MSVRYRNASGQETIIAGLTPGGDIEAGAVMTRTGTVSVTVPANSNATGYIFFDEPMPDVDYIIDLQETSGTGGLGVTVASGKSTTGFSINVANMNSIQVNTSWKYIATKTYTIQHAAQNAESIATLEAMVPSGAGASNKLVTASQLTNITSPISDAVDDIQDLIPVGASISNQLVTASQASVDSALSTTSEHAVQNKVVKAALDAKQDTLVYDNLPTENSTKMVKSGGIYNSEAKIWESNGKLGAKNLISYPYFYGNVLVKNINYIDNGDGSITANGTNSDSSNNAYYPINYSTPEPGTYILSGSTSNIMVLWVQKYNGDEWIDNFGYVYSGLTELEFTVDYDGYDRIRTLLSIGPNKSVSNETVYPMIRRKDDPNTAWQPYAKTNHELTKEKVEIDTFNRLGAKNLLHNTGTTTTNSGVTFTMNDDGSVTINGTASSYVGVSLGKTTLKEGRYILSLNKGVQVGLGVRNKAGSGWTMLVSPSPDHGYEKPFTITAEEAGDHYVYIFLESYAPGGTNITAYPMIRVDSDTDNTWQPYAMSNRELTKNVTPYRITNFSTSEYVSNSDYIKIFKLGSMVEIIFNAPLTGLSTTYAQQKILVSGLPKPITETYGCLATSKANTSSPTMRTIMTTAGNFSTDSLNQGVEDGMWYAGQMIYFTNE